MAQAYIAKQRAEAEEEIESLPEPEYSDVFCDSMDRIVKELNQKEQPAKKHTRIKKETGYAWLPRQWFSLRWQYQLGP